MLMEKLQRKFEITVNMPNNFIGMEIERVRESKTIVIHQSNYIKNLLSRFNMTECQVISTPMESSLSLLTTKNIVQFHTGN